jgi:hypothetical protein
MTAYHCLTEYDCSHYGEEGDIRVGIEPQNGTFFSPCDIWRQRGTMTSSCSEFNSHLSVTQLTNFNIAGEYVTLQNCSLYRKEYV